MFHSAAPSSSPHFSDSIVGPLHVIHSFRINLFHHVFSMGRSPDVYFSVVVSTGCSGIFAHLHRLLSLSGPSALAWALKRWQLLPKMSACSSPSYNVDICSGRLHQLKRNLFSGVWTTSFFSFSDFGVHRVSSHTFFQISLLNACTVFCLFRW